MHGQLHNKYFFVIFCPAPRHNPVAVLRYTGWPPEGIVAGFLYQDLVITDKDLFIYFKMDNCTCSDVENCINLQQ
jgi:hypothetical protein